jgi:hypothetical protein
MAPWWTKRARSWKRRTQPRKTYSLSELLYSRDAILRQPSVARKNPMNEWAGGEVRETSYVSDRCLVGDHQAAAKTLK